MTALQLDVAVPRPTGGAATERARQLTPLRAVLGYCALVYAAVRAAYLLLGYLAAHLPSSAPMPAPGWTATGSASRWHWAVTAWERMDVHWLLGIAESGYREGDGSGAFFPLWPVLVRAVGELTGGRMLLAGYLVSNVALLVALVLLHRLTERELSAAAARRAVLYLAGSPAGFFLFAPYTESLFLLLCLAFFAALRSDRWHQAALWCCAAGATRSAGLLLLLPMVVHAALLLRSRSRSDRWHQAARRVPGLLLGAAGALSYAAYWALRGSWREPLDVQTTAFHRHPAWPWEPLVEAVGDLVMDPADPRSAIRHASLLLVAVGIAAGVWAVRRLPAVYGVFVLGSLLMPLTLVKMADPLMAVPRYYAVVFPLHWALARYAERRDAHLLVLGGSAVLAVVLAVLFIGWHGFL